jgi:hypothetical protein
MGLSSWCVVLFRSVSNPSYSTSLLPWIAQSAAPSPAIEIAARNPPLLRDCGSLQLVEEPGISIPAEIEYADLRPIRFDARNGQLTAVIRYEAVLTPDYLLKGLL